LVNDVGDRDTGSGSCDYKDGTDDEGDRDDTELVREFFTNGF
jgi:hypothetical protein